MPVLDNITNAIILSSAWSAGNSWLYLASRSLYSLAVAGDAPAIFKKCNRWGLPYYAVGATALYTPLAYLSLGSSSSTVFDWFVNLTNTSGFISWICCAVIYFRFRKACKVHGVAPPYQSIIQPWGAYIALVSSIFLVFVNGFTVFFPSEWSVSSFFTSYIGIPAFLVLFVGHKAMHWKEPWVKPAELVDMQTGLSEVLEAEKPERVRDTWWKKAMVVIE